MIGVEGESNEEKGGGRGGREGRQGWKRGNRMRVKCRITSESEAETVKKEGKGKKKTCCPVSSLA